MTSVGLEVRTARSGLPATEERRGACLGEEEEESLELFGAIRGFVEMFLKGL